MKIILLKEAFFIFYWIFSRFLVDLDVFSYINNQLKNDK